MSNDLDPCDLRDPAVYRTPDLEGDLVMKGGITSGIVYPLAICELARRYRLRNVGGTSAGAIAAAVAAAAEYGRGSSGAGFAALAAIPDWLGSGSGDRSNMLRLFQPAPSTRPLFDLLLAMIGGGRGGRRPWGLLTLLPRLGASVWLGLLPGALLAVALILAEPGPGLPGLALAALLWLAALALGFGLPMLVAASARTALGAGTVVVPLLLIGGPAALAWLTALPWRLSVHIWAQEAALLTVATGGLAGTLAAAARKLTRAVPDNAFGICTGNTETTGGGSPGLTPWLHERIQTLAGRSSDDPPLTFRDLETRDPQRPVNLRMMTTCLTLGRPYLLPLATKVYYFDADEFRLLFPPAVVDYLIATAAAWSRGDDPDDAPNDSDCLVNRWMLPRLPLPLAKLPIVVATRMSLSFPVLLSAVPLWRIDWRRKQNREARGDWSQWTRSHPDQWASLRLAPERPAPDAPPRSPEPERCWFSDGGICSNFPVHLFDPLLPERPTFGINLKYREDARGREDRVDLPSRWGSAILEPWTRFDPQASGSGGRLLQFFGAILGSMQNWADNSLLPVASYRDRIVHLRLAPEEGGLNLNMTSPQIASLSGWGREAGAALRERFTNTRATGSELSWDNHRWARFRSTMALLERGLRQLVHGYRSPGLPTGRTYESMIARQAGEHPTSYRWRRKLQGDLALQTMQTFEELVDLWDRSKVDFQDDRRPHPDPALHIRAPLAS